MKTDFEVGQLVRSTATRDLGRVVAVDRDYYGARQAFKVYGAKPGQVIRPGSENGIGPTKDGIRDRVKVQWYTNYKEWGDSMTLVDGQYLSLMEE
jgi:hypothetical protein